MASSWSGDDHARFYQLVRGLAFDGPEALRDLFPEAFAADEHAAAWDEKYGDKSQPPVVEPPKPVEPAPVDTRPLGVQVASSNQA